MEQLLLEGFSIVTELESGLAGDLLLDTSAPMLFFFVGLDAGTSLSIPFEAVFVLLLWPLVVSLIVFALVSPGGGDGEAVDDTLGLAASR